MVTVGGDEKLVDAEWEAKVSSDIGSLELRDVESSDDVWASPGRSS